MGERQFTDEERAQLASAGHALPDGSYPIPDCDALRRAVEGYGRAPAHHRPELRRLIARRKVELECEDVQLPDSWRLRAGR